MDATKGLRLLAASLMTLNGVIHLVETAFTAGTWMAVMALFGVLYVAVGIGLLAVHKRISYYLGVIIPLVGASVAALHDYSDLVMVTRGFEYVYTFVRFKTPLIVIDIIVIPCCCYLILHKTHS
jgi:hypothetical protein